MRFVCIGMQAADVLNLMKNYAAALIVSNKTLLEAPIEFFAGGAGPVTTYQPGNLGTADEALNGVADPRAIASITNIEDQIVIDSGETFRVELNGSSFTTAAALFVRCYLDGRWGKVVN